MPPARDDAGDRLEIRDKAKAHVLAQLRHLWYEANRATLQAETAKAQAVTVMRQVKEFADRIRTGVLDPYEALAILDPTHPDVEHWLACIDEAEEQRLKPDSAREADVG